MFSGRAYFLVAPRRVRPASDVRMVLSVRHLRYNALTLRIAIARNEENLATAEEVFTEASTRTTLLRVSSGEAAVNFIFR